MGARLPSTTARLMVTEAMLLRLGTSNMTSSMIFSKMERRARAPVPRRKASSARAWSPSLVTLSFTPLMASSLEYCLMSAFLGWVRISISSSVVSSRSDEMMGRRPINSGISPKWRRSSGSALSSNVFTSRACSAVSPFSWKPSTCLPSRRLIMSLMPTKAPPHTKRILSVLTWMYSCCGCFLPPWGGTLQMCLRGF